jgi:hypothetical protein
MKKTASDPSNSIINSAEHKQTSAVRVKRFVPKCYMHARWCVINLKRNNLSFANHFQTCYLLEKQTKRFTIDCAARSNVRLPCR